MNFLNKLNLDNNNYKTVLHVVFELVRIDSDLNTFKCSDLIIELVLKNENMYINYLCYLIIREWLGQQESIQMDKSKALIKKAIKLMSDKKCKDQYKIVISSALLYLSKGNNKLFINLNGIEMIISQLNSKITLSSKLLICIMNIIKYIILNEKWVIEKLINNNNDNHQYIIISYIANVLECDKYDKKCLMLNMLLEFISSETKYNLNIINGTLEKEQNIKERLIVSLTELWKHETKSVNICFKSTL